MLAQPPRFWHLCDMLKILRVGQAFKTSWLNLSLLELSAHSGSGHIAYSQYLLQLSQGVNGKFLQRTMWRLTGPSTRRLEEIPLNQFGGKPCSSNVPICSHLYSISVACFQSTLFTFQLYLAIFFFLLIYYYYFLK